MTTPRPVFGKKTSATAAATKRPARSAPSAELSAEAQAFLQRERQSKGAQSGSPQPAGRRPYEEAAPGKASADGASAGKPVWGRRVIARLVDEFLIWTLIFLMFHDGLGRAFRLYIEGTPGSATENAAVLSLLGYALLWGLIECVYNIVMEASRYQATLGKLMVGAVVTDRNGGKPGLGGVIMRNTVGRFFANMVPFYAGYVMGLFRKDRRCLHDIMSGTMVRKRDPAGATAGYSEVFA